MRVIREQVRFGPSTGSIIEEAESRDIPYIRLNEQSLVQLGYGVHQQRIQATVTNRTNMISVDIASNKAATKKLLGEMGVPVPKGFHIRKMNLKAPLDLSVIRSLSSRSTAITAEARRSALKI